MRKLGIPPEQLQPNRYIGPGVAVVPVVEAKRRPTTLDTIYPIWTEWRVDSNPTTGSEGEFWKLVYFTGGDAIWVRMATTGAEGTLTTLTVDNATGPGVNPVTPDGGGTINLNGAVVASGSNPIRTQTSAEHDIDIEVQLAGSSASDPGNTDAVGLVQLNSSDFTITGNGFMSLAAAVSPASLGMDTGTSPVVVNGSGVIALTGAAVANAGIPLQSNGTGANTATMEIQVAKDRTGAPAPGSKADAGICSFSDADFDVTSDGYVTILGGAGSSVTQVTVDAASGGTNPVLPSSGNITVSGALVAAGSTPIQSISRSANSYNIEVQTAQNIPSPANSNNVGMASFDDGAFVVNSYGWVRLAGSAGLPALQTVTGDGGSAVGPSGTGTINLNGKVIENQDRAKAVFVQGTPGSYLQEVEVQLGAATTGDPMDKTRAGLVCFNDTQFEVDTTSGYVKLKGAEDKPAIQTITTGDSTVVEPTNGNVNMQGGTGISVTGSGDTVTITNTSTDGGTGEVVLVDDFIWSGPNGNESGVIGRLGWTGADTLIQVPSEVTTGRPGVIELPSSLSLRGHFKVGGGEITYTWIIKPESLGSSGTKKSIAVGMLSGSGTATDNGIYFRYEFGVNSGNWQIICTDSTTSTTEDTGVAAVADWVKLSATINAGGTSVTFKIDDVETSGSPISTNIPSAAIMPYILATTEAGSPTYTHYLDYFELRQTLTISR